MISHSAWYIPSIQYMFSVLVCLLSNQHQFYPLERSLPAVGEAGDCTSQTLLLSSDLS